MDVPTTKAGFNASWVPVQLLVATESTCFRISYLSIYTTTVSLFSAILGLKLITFQQVTLQSCNQWTRAYTPFKQYIREENNAWMVAHQQGDKLKQRDIATWIQHAWAWIQHAWDRVSSATNINTWQSIGVHPMNLP
jgi:hypothetical protein